jgi:hypothetical protein
MRISKLIFVCACLIGLTQLVWSQNQHLFPSKQSSGIPGYLDPRTGKFTTQIQKSGVGTGENEELAGTPVLFRVKFNITINNYDQPAGSITSCHASIDTEDPLGFYSDDAVIIAAKSGGGWTCTVPILVSWTLQTPNSDTISACYGVEVFQVVSVGSVQEAFSGRTSSPPCLSIPVPTNTSTVTEDVTIVL